VIETETIEVNSSWYLGGEYGVRRPACGLTHL